MQGLLCGTIYSYVRNVR